MFRRYLCKFMLALGSIAPISSMAGELMIQNAWIRAAPPGMTMLAGYAEIRNLGKTAVTIIGARSDAFADVSLHETLEQNGVFRMQSLGTVELKPSTRLVLSPGHKHLMLMQPKQSLSIGSVVSIELLLVDGRKISADFVVRESAPAQ